MFSLNRMHNSLKLHVLQLNKQLYIPPVKYQNKDSINCVCSQHSRASEPRTDALFNKFRRKTDRFQSGMGLTKVWPLILSKKITSDV